MKVIVNQSKTICLPYEEGMLEWLLEHYPYSKYQILEIK